MSKQKTPTKGKTKPITSPGRTKRRKTTAAESTAPDTASKSPVGLPNYTAVLERARRETLERLARGRDIPRDLPDTPTGRRAAVDLQRAEAEGRRAALLQQVRRSARALLRRGRHGPFALRDTPARRLLTAILEDGEIEAQRAAQTEWLKRPAAKFPPRPKSDAQKVADSVWRKHAGRDAPDEDAIVVMMVQLAPDLRAELRDIQSGPGLWEFHKRLALYWAAGLCRQMVQTPDDDGKPYYKPSHFAHRWHIGDELLRRRSNDSGKYTEGKVRRRKVPSSSVQPKRPTYWYSEPDVRKCWPHKFAEQTRIPEKT